MLRALVISVAVLLCSAWLVSAADAAAPVPPFTACPAVGADTSCALLIYIDPAGTPSVVGDPTQGPYDSIEDTLIGVQNDSSRPISSLPVSATSGKDLFGFDGDGLCTMINAPAGCPFGTTGYEGVGTSFTSISSDLTSGVINFSPAIPPGGHAYFSLEQALSTVPPFDINPGPPNGGLQTFTASSSANEPVVAVNPTNPKNIVIAFNHINNGGVFCGERASMDGGATWSPTHDLALPRAKGVAAVGGGGDPSLAFTAAGRLFFSCLTAGDAEVPGSSTHHLPPRELFAAVSGDGGINFGPSVILVHGSVDGHGGTIGPDQEQLAAAPSGSAVYMCYTFYAGNNNDTGVRVGLIGEGAEGPYLLNRASASAGTHQQHPQGCTVSVAASGRVWAAWWDSGAGAQGNPGSNQAFAAYSDNGALSFAGVTSVGPKRGVLWDPSLASNHFYPERHVYVQASPASGDGRVIALWEDAYRGTDTLQQSVNSGSGWGPAATVATNATQPSLAWGADGNVAYGYYSNPNLDGSELLFGVAQTNGPASGLLSATQSSGPPSSELSGLGPFPRFADYSGVAEAGGIAYGAWTDNSGGAQAVAYGHN